MLCTWDTGGRGAGKGLYVYDFKYNLMKICKKLEKIFVNIKIVSIFVVQFERHNYGKQIFQ